MQSLAVKYRPHKLSEVVEQDSIKVILKQQLESEEIPHACLFVGSAGTGKTTIGRIFANEINKGKGNPLELDAASNNSVDDIRNIIQQAKVQSMDSEYRCFLIDECFPSNALISTPKGSVPISNIRVGDIVKSMCGSNKVTYVFKSSVLTSRLCCISINKNKIITTKDHLFFTNNGWVKAIDLQQGDRVYATGDMSKLWEGISNKTQNSEILLPPVLSGISQTTLSAEDENSNLSGVWKTVSSEEFYEPKNVFKDVYGHTNFKVRKDVYEYRIWYGVTETIIRKNVQKQSNESFRVHSKGTNDQGEEWNSSSMEGDTRWEWEVHNSADTLMASIRRWVDIRVSNSDKVSTGRTSISYVLQSRPWLSVNDACSRGRWQKPQLEKSIIERCEKRAVSNIKRVDSVEVYQRGYNDELFRGSFTDTELSQEYVTLYDLEVENDHSYFVNDILVHNCHSLSNSAWQAFLKLLEEPPAKSVFILCTTEAQKIPRTILSRVQRFNFRRISQDGIFNRLKYVIEQENSEGRDYTYTDDALKYLSRMADGGLRDSLTLLDKCLAYSKELTIENVIQALGTVDYEVFFDLSDQINKKQGADVIRIIEKVHADGKDLKQFIKDYMSFLLDINKYDILKSFDYLQIPSTYEEALKNYKQDWYDTCRRLLPAVVKMNYAIKWETQPKVEIEARLLGECIR